MRSRTMTQPTTSGESARLTVLAVLLGTVLNRAGKGFPGTVGPLAVCVGLWMAWPPLGIIALGLILWSLDRKIT